MSDENNTDLKRTGSLDEAAEKLLRAKQRNVLLVEDTAAHAALIRRALDTATWQIHHVTRASEAISAFGGASSWIVLLDLSLPDADGLWLLAELHRIDPQTPIIVVTAREQVSASVEAMQRGACNYVVKGDPAETAEKIRNAVEQAYVLRLQQAESRLIDESRLLQRMRAERLHAIELIVRTVCHEVNNPLSGVVALSQLLQKHEKTIVDEDLKRLAEGIARSAHDVAQVVQKLRHISDQETEFGGKTIFELGSNAKPQP